MAGRAHGECIAFRQILKIDIAGLPQLAGGRIYGKRAAIIDKRIDNILPIRISGLIGGNDAVCCFAIFADGNRRRIDPAFGDKHRRIVVDIGEVDFMVFGCRLALKLKLAATGDIRAFILGDGLRAFCVDRQPACRRRGGHGEGAVSHRAENEIATIGRQGFHKADFARLGGGVIRAVFSVDDIAIARRPFDAQRGLSKSDDRTIRQNHMTCR